MNPTTSIPTSFKTAIEERSSLLEKNFEALKIRIKQLEDELTNTKNQAQQLMGAHSELNNCLSVFLEIERKAAEVASLQNQPADTAMNDPSQTLPTKAAN